MGADSLFRTLAEANVDVVFINPDTSKMCMVAAIQFVNVTAAAIW